jgi:hypothetical protein
MTVGWTGDRVTVKPSEISRRKCDPLKVKCSRTG